MLSQRQETNSLVNNASLIYYIQIYIVQNFFMYLFFQIDEEMSTLKIKYNALLLENKSLKEQLSNFRNLHNQVL